MYDDARPTCEYRDCELDAVFVISRSFTTHACAGHLAQLVPSFANVRRLRPVPVPVRR